MRVASAAKALAAMLRAAADASSSAARFCAKPVGARRVLMAAELEALDAVERIAGLPVPWDALERRLYAAAVELRLAIADCLGSGLGAPAMPAAALEALAEAARALQPALLDGRGRGGERLLVEAKRRAMGASRACLDYRRRLDAIASEPARLWAHGLARRLSEAAEALHQGAELLSEQGPTR